MNSPAFCDYEYYDKDHMIHNIQDHMMYGTRSCDLLQCNYRYHLNKKANDSHISLALVKTIFTYAVYIQIIS